MSNALNLGYAALAMAVIAVVLGGGHSPFEKKTVTPNYNVKTFHPGNTVRQPQGFRESY